jgi:hypothetical protein
MARRSSLFSGYARMQRELAPAQAARVQAEADAQREAERAHAAYLRAGALAEGLKRTVPASRVTDVAVMNADLEAVVKALEGILAAFEGWCSGQFLVAQEACVPTGVAASRAGTSRAAGVLWA